MPARAHPTVGGLQHEHHKWKRERRSGEGIGADATQKVAVEDDDPHEREQVEHVGSRELQQRSRIGPVSRSLVRAAGGVMAAGLELSVPACWIIKRPPSPTGIWSSAWTKASWKTGRLQ